MSVTTSILEDLLQALPNLRSQVYFKSSLIALSHAMEDQVLASDDRPLVVASFQRERFYRIEAKRYLKIARATPQVYVLAAPESEFANRSLEYETIAFDPGEPLSQEWNLVVLTRNYGTCLVCQERHIPDGETSWLKKTVLDLDPARRFEGIWTFDRDASLFAADRLLDRILVYRPELAEKVADARETYGIDSQGLEPSPETVPAKSQRDRLVLTDNPPSINPGPFAERLIAYLQAGQYKLLKAYRSISAQEEKERLVNSITSAIRESLDPNEILEVAVGELGQALDVCRCSIYRCKDNDVTTTIAHEYARPEVSSLVGETWQLRDNPLFREVATRKTGAYVDDTSEASNALVRTISQLLTRSSETGSSGLGDSEAFRISTAEGKHPEVRSTFAELVERWEIGAWLMMPVLYRDRLLGIIELHHCRGCPHAWGEDELALVNTIATQIGTALIQAETYAHLEDLNQQLEALERTRSNLIAITGHELRTPLSTIQICLESLASEPDMAPELRQVMLNTALADADRLRELVQDFLTLSRFESGRVEWHLEPLSLRECVDLSLSSVHTRYDRDRLPELVIDVPEELPLVQADGEWLVQVLSKLLDNACKFTPDDGTITVRAHPSGYRTVKVTVADTGRGIEPDRVEAIFERFYQEEGALRRTTGGTGLGLAICRQAIQRWGGQVWAESEGKDRGSRFHFTIPILEDGRNSHRSPGQSKGVSASSKRRRS
ncbi:DICT sensory domain-containing protein [Baaleninema simplex]|uniref:DICT sensory domain-containing protein n=1 Tax=Baaleninema simplex TaxID=2862350 RepID=UPI000344E3FE|nr:DICT sensory domain-containing protein [Baaleninema simplex]